MIRGKIVEIKKVEYKESLQFCGECKELNYTEKEQNLIHSRTGKKFNHFCGKHNRRLFHLDCHPKIIKCSECLEKCYQEYKKNENNKC